MPNEDQKQTDNRNLKKRLVEPTTSLERWKDPLTLPLDIITVVLNEKGGEVVNQRKGYCSPHPTSTKDLPRLDNPLSTVIVT